MFLLAKWFTSDVGALNGFLSLLILTESEEYFQVAALDRLEVTTRRRQRIYHQKRINLFNLLCSSGTSLLIPVKLIHFDAPSSSVLIPLLLSGRFRKGLERPVGKFRAIICLDLSLFKWVALMSQREFSQLNHMCGYEKNENRFDWNFLPEDRRRINKVAPFTTTSHKEACWTEKKN